MKKIHYAKNFKESMVSIEQIRQNLIDAIKQSGLSQTEIAKKLGVTQSSIAHYMRGDVFPTMDKFANLCSIIEIDPEDIFKEDSTGLFKYNPIGTVKDYYTFPVNYAITRNNGKPEFKSTNQIVALSWKQIDVLRVYVQDFNWKKVNDYFFALKVADNSMFSRFNEGDIVICLRNSKPYIGQGYDGILFDGSGDVAKVRRVYYNYTNEPTVKLTHYDNDKIESEYLNTLHGDNYTVAREVEEVVDIKQCLFVGKVLMTIRNNTQS